MTDRYDPPAGADSSQQPQLRPQRGAEWWRRVAINTAYFSVCTVLTLMFLFPIVWSLLTSFETAADAMSSPPLYWPSRFSLENYRNLAKYGQGIQLYLWNSGSIAVMTVAFTLVLSTLGGYGFSRFRFPGRPRR